MGAKESRIGFLSYDEALRRAITTQNRPLLSHGVALMRLTTPCAYHVVILGQNNDLFSGTVFLSCTG